MIGVVLTAGRGSRLSPVTKVVNKSVLPVGGKPMIAYPLMTLIKSGIKEIVVVTGLPFGEQVEIVVDALNLEAKIRYVEQIELLGMPDAIKQVKPLVRNKSIIVMGADNIFGGNYKKYIKKFRKGEISFLRKVDDPRRYGVPIYNKKGEVVDIVEKPKEYSGKRMISGPHIFDNSVFKAIELLKPSTRGELEIVDLHLHYLKKGQLQLLEKNDYWQDLGTFNSLSKTNADIINGVVKFEL